MENGHKLLSRIVSVLVNVFIWGFLIDAVLTAIDIGLSQWIQYNGLTSVRLTWAGWVWDLASLCLVLSIALTQFRGWGVFALALITIWLNEGGLPLRWLIEPPDFSALYGWLVAIQLFAGIWAVIAVRRSSKQWWLSPSVFEGRPGWKNWLKHSLARFGVLVLAVLVVSPFSYATMVEQATGGYLAFSKRGVYVRDVTYKNDVGKTARLVGMIHFGDGATYYDMYHSFAQPQTVILAEGVSDRTQILGAHPPSPKLPSFESGLMRQPSMLGVPGSQSVDNQTPSANGWVDVVNADVDMSELSLPTQQWLSENQDLFLGNQPLSLAKLWQMVVSSDPANQEMFDELLNDRNASIMTHFHTLKDAYQHVIIPWGALHQWDLTQQILAIGYTPEEDRWHLLLPWSVLFAQTSSSRTQTGNEAVDSARLGDYVRTLKKVIERTRKRGIVLNLEPASEPTDALPNESYFGGVPLRFEGESWPLHPETSRPMTFVAQISRNSTNADYLGNIKRLRLFLDYDTFYGDNEEGSYRLLIEYVGEQDPPLSRYAPDDIEQLLSQFGDSDSGNPMIGARQRISQTVSELIDDRLVYEVPPSVSDLNTWFNLTDQALLELNNAGLRSAMDLNVIGGQPYWVQYEEPAEHPMLMQLAPLNDLMWGDGGHLYIHLDPTDPDSEVVINGQSS